MRNQINRKFTVWLVVVAFFLTGVSPAFSGSRIMPSGKVKVFEGQKLVQIIKQESPFPNGALLSTEGKCAVRLENLYLVAEDGCTFCVLDALYQKDLRVDKGRVFFAITTQTDKLNFLTPAGEISTQQFRLNAAANAGLLKGYLDVGASKVQLGVLEGGSMVVSTVQGIKEIQSGKRITLALEDPVNQKGKKEDASGKEAAGDKIPPADFAVGSALLGAFAVTVYNTRGSSVSPETDFFGPEASPSSP